ncbi:hypothetical protein JCM6882_000535 [Rhodosporidiobolus microsporus]
MPSADPQTSSPPPTATPKPALGRFSVSAIPAFNYARFLLVSSDGARFAVAKEQLAASSRVFADMLELGGGEQEVTLSEGKRVISSYIAVMKGRSAPYNEEDWYALCEMADKYDSDMVKKKLLTAARVLHSNANGVGLRTFAAGCLLDNPLLKVEGASSAKVGEISFLYQCLSAADKVDLELFRASRLEVLRCSLRGVKLQPFCSVNPVPHLFRSIGATNDATWALVLQDVTGQLKSDDGVFPHTQINAALAIQKPKRSGCPSCDTALSDAIASAENAYHANMQLLRGFWRLWTTHVRDYSALLPIDLDTLLRKA